MHLLLGTPPRASVFPICPMEPRTPEPSSTHSPTSLVSSGQGDAISLTLCWHFPAGLGLEQPPCIKAGPARTCPAGCVVGEGGHRHGAAAAVGACAIRAVPKPLLFQQLFCAGREGEVPGDWSRGQQALLVGRLLPGGTRHPQWASSTAAGLRAVRRHKQGAARRVQNKGDRPDFNSSSSQGGWGVLGGVDTSGISNEKYRGNGEPGPGNRDAPPGGGEGEHPHRGCTEPTSGCAAPPGSAHTHTGQKTIFFSTLLPLGTAGDILSLPPARQQVISART